MSRNCRTSEVDEFPVPAKRFRPEPTPSAQELLSQICKDEDDSSCDSWSLKVGLDADEVEEYLKYALKKVAKQKETETVENTDVKFNWLELPCEIRYKIIEQMDSGTRASFFLCSNQSALDMPKYPVKKIKLGGLECGPEYKEYVTLGAYSDDYKSCFFEISIEKKGDHCIIMDTKSDSSWKVTREGMLMDATAEFFQKMVNCFTLINEISIINVPIPNKYCSINNLQKLSVFIYKDYYEHETMDMINTGFISLNKISSLEKVKLTCPLVLSDMIKLRCKYIKINSVIVTSQYVNEYLKALTDNKIDENVGQLLFERHCDWIDIEQMIDGLKPIGLKRSNGGDESKLFALALNANDTKLALVEAFVISKYGYVNIKIESIDVIMRDEKILRRFEGAISEIRSK